MIDNGKAAIIIDGQYGSSGKGLLAGYVGWQEKIDIVTTNFAPNSGHTCILPHDKIVVHQLPMAGVINKETGIYLNAGSIINPLRLFEEMKKYAVERERVTVHPRAAVITAADIVHEESITSRMRSIGSTRQGVGSALACKILRQAALAGDVFPSSMCKVLDLNEMMDGGARILVEVPQGIDLGINTGLSYPYCTSRDITVSQAIADAGIHPSYLGKVAMVVRTYPIRVGNVLDDDGTVLGWSGPCYPDQDEIKWGDVGVEAETTTTTGRPRRVFSWSKTQYQKSLKVLRPDIVFLNFVNYLGSWNEYCDFVAGMGGRGPDMVGVGPRPQDVFNTDEGGIAMMRKHMRREGLWT